jgi:hypothetical protein
VVDRVTREADSDPQHNPTTHPTAASPTRPISLGARPAGGVFLPFSLLSLAYLKTLKTKETQRHYRATRVVLWQSSFDPEAPPDTGNRTWRESASAGTAR